MVDPTGHNPVSLPDNPLGLSSLEDLVDWTESYLHFKHALEVIAFTPEMATSYVNCFSDFSARYATEMKKQDILEARLPKKMRQTIEADNPHRGLLRQIFNGESTNRSVDKSR